MKDDINFSLNLPISNKSQSNKEINLIITQTEDDDSRLKVSTSIILEFMTIVFATFSLVNFLNNDSFHEMTKPSIAIILTTYITFLLVLLIVNGLIYLYLTDQNKIKYLKLILFFSKIYLFIITSIYSSMAKIYRLDYFYLILLIKIFSYFLIDKFISNTYLVIHILFCLITLSLSFSLVKDENSNIMNNILCSLFYTFGLALIKIFSNSNFQSEEKLRLLKDKIKQLENSKITLINEAEYLYIKYTENLILFTNSNFNKIFNVKKSISLSKDNIPENIRISHNNSNLNLNFNSLSQNVPKKLDDYTQISSLFKYNSKENEKLIDVINLTLCNNKNEIMYNFTSLGLFELRCDKTIDYIFEVFIKIDFLQEVELKFINKTTEISLDELKLYLNKRNEDFCKIAHEFKTPLICN